MSKPKLAAPGVYDPTEEWVKDPKTGVHVSSKGRFAAHPPQQYTQEEVDTMNKAFGPGGLFGDVFGTGKK